MVEDRVPVNPFRRLLVVVSVAITTVTEPKITAKRRILWFHEDVYSRGRGEGGEFRSISGYTIGRLLTSLVSWCVLHCLD